MWQLLRGSVIIWVALVKHFVLKDHLTSNMWCGVLFVALAITVVGLAGALGGGGGDSGASGSTLALGIFLTLCGTLTAGIQFAVEEKMMSGMAAPPLLLVGMEGICGFVITVCIFYPAYYYLPGDDHGHFEDAFNTLAKLRNSPTAVFFVCCYTALVFTFNVTSMFVVQRLSAVWKAILQNCRPASIWAAQLVIYNLTGGEFGEAWAGFASWMQLVGMGLLLLGIAVYNGSVPLPCVDSTEASEIHEPSLCETAAVSAGTRYASRASRVSSSRLTSKLLPE